MRQVHRDATSAIVGDRCDRTDTVYRLLQPNAEVAGRWMEWPGWISILHVLAAGPRWGTELVGGCSLFWWLCMSAVGRQPYHAAQV
jgi:hypothetical protein